MREKENTPLYLCVAEYFVKRKVRQYPIYAKDLEEALVKMNAFYVRTRVGHAHKSLERNTAGIEIEMVYYPPKKTGEVTTSMDEGT